MLRRHTHDDNDQKVRRGADVGGKECGGFRKVQESVGVRCGQGGLVHAGEEWCAAAGSNRTMAESDQWWWRVIGQWWSDVLMCSRKW